MNESEILRELVSLSARLDSVEQKATNPVVVREPTPSDVHHHIHELDKARRAIEDRLIELGKCIPNLDDLAVIRQELGSLQEELDRCFKAAPGQSAGAALAEAVQPLLTMIKNLNRKVDVALKQASKAADQASSAVRVHCRIASETLEAIAITYSQE